MYVYIYREGGGDGSESENVLESGRKHIYDYFRAIIRVIIRVIVMNLQSIFNQIYTYIYINLYICINVCICMYVCVCLSLSIYIYIVANIQSAIRAVGLYVLQSHRHHDQP